MEGLSIIGNCQYNALINRNGNVDWMCWPRFDSSFVFGQLVDDERGGSFQIAPAGEWESHQEYVPNTNVIKTRFKAEDGVFDIIDFAPRFQHNSRYFKPNMLIRVLIPIEGQPLIKVSCRPVYDYGRLPMTPVPGLDGLLYETNGMRVRLTTDIALNHIAEERPFVLANRRYMVLTNGEIFPGPLASTCEDYLDRTIQYWRRWVKHCYLPETYQREVIRSALVLKIHQYEDTGAIIAATTTSIPEAPGSSRNWDYRYCWLRDSYFTVQALLRLSHFEELEGFERFLRDTLRANPGEIRPLYKISGEAKVEEYEIHELKGYRQHGPFRVGNAAYLQVQNDVYGQAILSLSPLFTDVRFLADGMARDFHLIVDLLEKLEQNLEEPDAGLWEFRGINRPHAFTMLMNWAGSKAAARAAVSLNKGQVAEKAMELAKKAGNMLMRRFWDDDLGCFVMAPGTHELDASMLMAVNLGFLRHDIDKANQLVNAIRKQLAAPCGLLHRYALKDDGFGETTAAFTVCSFWLAESLAHLGRTDEAIQVFEQVMRHSNNVGLLSEDIDPVSGQQWGNFPQTYSHVGVINSAFAIDKALQAKNFDPLINSPVLL